MAFIKQIKKQLGNFSKKEGEGLVALKEFNLYPSQPDNDERLDRALVDTLLRRPPVSLDEESPVPTVEAHEEESVGEELDDDRLQAYSHGLEEVYTLENVDLSTVRRLGGEKTPEALVEPVKTRESCEEPDTLDFDLGQQWRGWMPSLVLKEPISVLGLPEQVVKNFHEDERYQIGDIYRLTQEEMMGLRLGQGHIDEVCQRLKRYLDGKPLRHARQIEFTSWLRSILAETDSQQRYLLLEAYGLSTLFPLSPAQTMEIRRMAPQLRQRKQKEAFEQGITQEHRRRFAAVWHQVINTFIQPWMFWRQGLALYYELEERLERLATDRTMARNVLKMFAEVFFQGRLPFAGYLHEVEPALFAADEKTAAFFREVIAYAETYFYQSDAVYPIEDLVSYIERERARVWSGYPEGFVERALKVSSKFRVRKTTLGLCVRLNPLKV